MYIDSIGRLVPLFIIFLFSFLFLFSCSLEWRRDSYTIFFLFIHTLLYMVYIQSVYVRDHVISHSLPLTRIMGQSKHKQTNKTTKQQNNKVLTSLSDPYSVSLASPERRDAVSLLVATLVDITAISANRHSKRTKITEKSSILWVHPFLIVS